MEKVLVNFKIDADKRKQFKKIVTFDMEITMSQMLEQLVDEFLLNYKNRKRCPTTTPKY